MIVVNLLCHIQLGTCIGNWLMYNMLNDMLLSIQHWFQNPEWERETKRIVQELLRIVEGI